VFVLRVEGTAAETRTLRAVKGDRVRIQVIANRPVVLHIHGLDLEILAGPDRRGEANLTTSATGRFPVHLHDTADAKAARSHHHKAPFAYLEVHPK
jgi:FtsP/CotA-like multicopper oxidase with cupredoxin domain